MMLPFPKNEHIFVRIPLDMITTYASVWEKYRFNLEIYIDSAALDNYSMKEINAIAVKTDQLGIKVRVHGPFLDLSPGSSDRLVRQLALKRYRKTLAMGTDLHASSIVFHPGYDPFNYCFRNEEWLTYSIQTWHDLLQSSVDQEPFIYIENVFEKDTHLLGPLFEKLETDRVWHCFDIGHFNVYAQVSLESWMNDLGQYMKEIHIHDNDGESDQHAALGMGTIPFDQFFHLLQKQKLDPVFTLENLNVQDTLQSYKAVTDFISAQK